MKRTKTSLRTVDGRRMLARYDYVIVGSGSAGSTIASRLAEDPARKVLLLEAGPKDNSIIIRMPAALGLPLGNDKYNWYLHTEPEPGLNARPIYEARGRVLGGSSSINGLNWVRGNPWDYDQWAAKGLTGWSYADCLPYFRKAETFHGAASPYRGTTGPMMVERCQAKNPLFEAFLRAGEQAGYQYVDDHNAFRQEGIHITQRNVYRGLRWSTSQAYLHARGALNNLHVVCKAFVTRVRLDKGIATAVEVDVNGEGCAIEAEHEIIICAGAIHSPHLLMHSGIGDADQLNKHGVALAHHLPGVGRGLKDHMSATIQYRETSNASVAKHMGVLGRLNIGAQWWLFKRGLGVSNFFEVGAFIRTRDGVQVPDIQFEFLPFLGEFHHGAVKVENGFQYYFSLMRPTSAGRVTLRSANPHDPPAFQFNYLSTPQDQQTAVDAMQAIRVIVRQSAWSSLRGVEVAPGSTCTTDAQVLAYLRASAGTNYHPACSCRMGTDEKAVVDTQARVRGLRNLRVIDASIMPEIVTGNLNAPVIMMAEKLADDIRGRTPLTPQPAPYYQG